MKQQANTAFVSHTVLWLWRTIDRVTCLCSGVRSDDYEKLVDREVRAAIQRMQAAEDAKQQGLRTWRLPESLKVDHSQ